MGETVDIFSFGDVFGESFGVADAAPRLKADERTTLLVRRPDAVSLSLRTVDIQDGVAVSVPQLNLCHLSLFDNQGIMKKSIRHKGRFAQQHDLRVSWNTASVVDIRGESGGDKFTMLIIESDIAIHHTFRVVIR